MSYRLHTKLRIEGARRFTLAHELGHILSDIDNTVYKTSIESGLFSELGTDIPKHRLVELQSDYMALGAILSSCNQSVKLEGSELFKIKHYLVGIILYFIMLDIIDSALSDHWDMKSTHPSPGERLDFMLINLMQSSVCYSNEEIRDALTESLEQFRFLTSFFEGKDPEKDKPLVNWNNFYKQLTPFGKKAYHKLAWRFNKVINVDHEFFSKSIAIS